MKLLELNLDEYSAIYGDQHQHVFGTADFARLNAEKVSKIVCLSLVNDKSKHIAGLVAGERAQDLACPFSAPFGEICCPKPLNLEQIDALVTLLQKWLNGRQLRLTLAPAFYHPAMFDKLCGIMSRKAVSSCYDLNYHYPTEQFDNFIEHLDRSAHKNFNRATAVGFTFEKTEDLSRAYAIIERNRRERGYYLSMTEQQVRQTVETVVRADYFVLSYEGTDLASAIVFHVAPGIVQVIYWGNIEGYSELRPMNYLPYKIFEYYRHNGIKIVDIGPSSKDGVPNYGLCTFKESIGCIMTLKPTFYF